MDWQSGLAGDAQRCTSNHVIPAADFLVAHGPSDGVERWEEQSGYSPSTIAAEIAGLTAAAHIATVNGDAVRARRLPGHRRRLRPQHQELDGDDQRPVHQLDGAELLHPDRARPATRTSRDSVNLGNGSITRRPALADRRRLPRARPPRRPAGQRPDVTVVADGRRRHDRALRRRAAPASTATARADRSRRTATATATSRADAAARPTGAPWPPTDTGSGHLWPVLGGERGEYDVAAGDPSLGRRAADGRCGR